MKRAAGLFAVFLASAVGAAEGPAVAAAAPLAAVDLTTTAGAAEAGAVWRVRPAELVAVDFFEAGADGQPGDSPTRAWDVEPRAGWADYDDSGWPVVAPESLADRRGAGKLSFVWYRLELTLPDTLGGRPVAGAQAMLEVVVDDAAEVWVDGELRRCPGQAGGSMVAGWNAPNRVLLTPSATPGRTIRVAVFGVNGPLSGSATNYVWMKRARLELLVPDGGAPAARAVAPACEENVAVERFDPEADEVFSRNPKLFLIAEGLTFAEGPVWDPAGGGSLLFSDPNENRIYRWSEKGGLERFRESSGYAGDDVARYRQPGSNGLAIDARGRLVLDQHGNRRVVRLERDGRETVLAERDGGRRLNSPNDLAIRSDGTVYFTDPFFGLPGFDADPAKELPYQGVYRIVDGVAEPLATDLSGPNGIAFSPDEDFLYVGNWQDDRKVVMRYPLLADGRLGAGELFADLTPEPGEDAIDGVKTDEAGRVYVSGPGGLFVFASDGRKLARVRTPRHAHNFAWGEDGSVLYLAARDHLYRLPTRTRGHAPHLAPPPRIARLDPRFDLLVPVGARPELVVEGHHWLEGPAWDAEAARLVYSDIPRNAIFGVADGQRARTVRSPSGYSSAAPFAGREPGSNGLAFDSEGRLLACQHGDRRVVRFEPDGGVTVIADRFEGKRLNSPNDLVVRANGDVWFTDPPFGLPAAFADPGKELPFQGVYRVRPGGDAELLTDAVRAPNGLALSPDGSTLYVSNAEASDAAVYAFAVRDDGSLGAPRRFFDSTARVAAGAPGSADGLETDEAGDVWHAGPGGVRVLSPAGELLGSIEFERPVANLEIAPDGFVYFAADTAIWRLPVGVRKARP